MKKIIFFISLFAAPCFVMAQDCTVLLDSLKGKYDGECKQGLANGKGIAVGIDSFSGNFKNGVPDGYGKYFCKNGSWYNGSWKKGKYDGEGVYHKADKSNADSVNVAGYWKNGVYMGKYDKPYVIHSMSNAIEEVSVKKVKRPGEISVTITVKNTTGGALSAGTVSNEVVMSKSKLTNILVQKGRIDRQTTDETSSALLNRYVFRNIEFPLYATFFFDAEQLQLELLENVSYEITVNMVKWANPQLYNNPKGN